MMTYFRLKTSSDIADIGYHYPQIQEIGGTMQKDAPDSIYRVPTRKFPDFIPNLNHLILHPKAKLTDVLSSTHILNGFIVNQKVKTIFEGFNMINHSYYPAIICHKEAIYKDYYWFYPIGDLAESIDFEKTQFYMTDSFGEKTEITINNTDELTACYQEISSLKKIRSDKYYFKSESCPNKDLFFIHEADIRLFISENLAKKLSQMEVSGISMYDVSFI